MPSHILQAPPQSMKPRVRSACTRVPKTLGLAVCAGCNAKGFYKADGVHLEQCRQCGQVCGTLVADAGNVLVCSTITVVIQVLGIYLGWSWC